MKPFNISKIKAFLCASVMATGLACALPPENAAAQQVSFDVYQDSRYKKFNFGFRDLRGKTYTLDFKIPEKDLTEARQDMPRLSDPRVQQSLQQAQSELHQEYQAFFQKHMTSVVDEINTQLPQGMSASVEFQGMGYKVNIRDTSNASAQEREAVSVQVSETLKQHTEYAEQKFKSDLGTHRAKKLRNILPDYLYDFEMQDDGSALFMVDYSAVASRYRTAMRPLARALDDVISSRKDREVLNSTLNFFQSIPYDDFTGRDIADDARIGYVLPSLMLELNKGDCDTKSVALASTLLNMMPGEKSILILIPEHALLGVSIRPERGDAHIKYNGRRYVLMEPAGPGMAPVGQISSKSAQYINSGDYTVKELFR